MEKIQKHDGFNRISEGTFGLFPVALDSTEVMRIKNHRVASRTQLQEVEKDFFSEKSEET